MKIRPATTVPKSGTGEAIEPMAAAIGSRRNKYQMM